jgi:hypothetical protein
MDNNEIKGWFAYKGNTVQQHENAGNVFKKLFINKKPARILEIGTAYGGLTILLRDILNELNMQNTIIRTYDNYHKHYLDNIIGIESIIDNIFTKSYLELNDEKSKSVIEYIQLDGVTILLCDGGSKKDEFRLLSPYLKPGDIIMAHDYAPNQEYFNRHIKNKIWSWMEIEDSDIEESVILNNLNPYMSEEFTNVVWVCKEKN